MTKVNFVTAILQNDEDKILMVLVKADDMPQALWSLPGGRVEKGETARKAIMREVQEETGIIITELGQLAYQVSMQFDDRITLAQVFTVKSWSGEPRPDDPDGKVLQADWIPREQAIEHLKLFDYLPMSEPPIAYLSGHVQQGKHWQYVLSGEGTIWVNNADEE